MKRKPGQIALDAIIFYEAHLDNDWHDMRITTDERKSCFAELRAWRRVVVACGKAQISEKGRWCRFSYFYEKDEKNITLAERILAARRIEARRKP